MGTHARLELLAWAMLLEDLGEIRAVLPGGAAEGRFKALIEERLDEHIILHGTGEPPNFAGTIRYKAPKKKP
jgi:hypothetical protein